MSDDRTWIYNRIPSNKIGLTDEYRFGVNKFINFALDHADTDRKIKCPCVRCKNLYWKHINMVKLDLYSHGFVNGYTLWIHHGESTNVMDHN